LQDVS